MQAGRERVERETASRLEESGSKRGMRAIDALLLMIATMPLTMMVAGVEGDWKLELGEMCGCQIGATLLLLLAMATMMTMMGASPIVEKLPMMLTVMPLLPPTISRKVITKSIHMTRWEAADCEGALDWPSANTRLNPRQHR
jgi:hypothetical protein